MEKRRQLPLPEGIAPSRRAPPALPVDNDVPPPPVPSRPTPGRPSPSAPAVPTSSRPVPRPPPPQNKVPIHEQISVSDDDEDDSFESDSSSCESYEDMSGQDSQPPKPKPVLPRRGYLEPEKRRPPVPPPSKHKPAPQEEEVYDQAEVGPEEIEDEQQVYDDMDVENELQENYDEFGGVVQEPQETYDEFEGVEQEPQETYDEFEGVEQDTYEIEETQEEEGDLMYQECDVAPQDPAADIYQIADEDSPSPPPPPPSSAPALPPPRPRQKEETAAPPPPRNTAPKTFANKGGVGIPSIAMGDIQNIKDRLKKVSVRKSEPEQKEPKVYTDSNELQSKFNFFKQKEQEALLAKGSKPDISPKPVSLIKKPVPVKEDKTESPVLSTRPDDKSIPSHRNVSDSLPPLPSPVNKDLPPPPLPSPVNKDLPPPPPPLSVMPAHNRDLRPLPTSPAKPQNLSPRGKDGYTKVNFGEEENNNEDGELYEDALSYEDPLLKEKWYFGEIDRMVGNEKLKKFNQNGAYLLRKSTKGGEKQPYTLMVIYKNHVYNLKIRERNDGRMALGEEKPDEMSFKSVVDLIKHHQTNDVILVHRDGKQDTTLLQVSPPK